MLKMFSGFHLDVHWLLPLNFNKSFLMDGKVYCCILYQLMLAQFISSSEPVCKLRATGTAIDAPTVVRTEVPLNTTT